MRDLPTIQRMNQEAAEAQPQRVGEVYGLLSYMLYEYDELDGDVGNFILRWAERLTS